jgi:O-antigen ligase
MRKKTVVAKSLYQKQVVNADHEVARIPAWLFFVVVLQSILFPLMFGKLGIVLASLVLSTLVPLYYAFALPVTLDKKSVFGLVVLLLMFMNVDAIMPTLTTSERSAFVWVVLAMLLIYTAFNVDSIFRAVSERPLLFLFILFIIMQMAWSILLGATVVGQTAQRLFFFLAVFLVVADFLTQNSQEASISLLYAILLAGINSAIIMGMESLNPKLYSYSFDILGLERSAAAYINPGAGAFVISISGFVAAWLLYARRISLIMAFASLSIIVTGLVVTFSAQGGLSLFLIVLATGIALVPRNRLNVFVLFTVIVLVSVAVINMGGNVFESVFINRLDLSRDNQIRASTLTNIYSGDAAALSQAFERSQRSFLVEQSWEAIKRNPWLGYGTGLHTSDAMRNLPQFAPHNVFLLVWLEGGILALLTWAFMLIWVIFRNIRLGDAEKWFRLLIIANLFVFMMSRHILFFYRYLAIILALVFVIDQLVLSRENQIAHERK